MTFQSKVFFGQAAAFLAAAAIYLLGLYELAGLILLGTCAVFGVWVGFYLSRRGRSVPELDDPPEPGEIGSFPTATRWTPVLALAIVMMANGLVAGAWLLVAGLGLLVVAAVGYSFEFAGSEVTEPPAPRSTR